MGGSHFTVCLSREFYGLSVHIAEKETKTVVLTMIFLVYFIPDRVEKRNLLAAVVIMLIIVVVIVV